MARPGDMIVYDNSDRPSTQRSVIRKYADMLTLGNATELLRAGERTLGIGPVAAALHSVRASGESLVVGGILGAVSAAGGLDKKGVPVDLAGGISSVVAGVALASSELGVTLRTAGHTAIGIFGFRKTEEWLGVRKRVVESSGVSIGEDDSDVGADPIMAAAQAL